MAENWKVTDQTETTTQLGGQFVKAMRVSFTTADGHDGSVVVPMSSYGPDAVREAIDARAATMHDVANL